MHRRKFRQTRDNERVRERVGSEGRGVGRGVAVGRKGVKEDGDTENEGGTEDGRREVGEDDGSEERPDLRRRRGEMRIVCAPIPRLHVDTLQQHGRVEKGGREEGG